MRVALALPLAALLLAEPRGPAARGAPAPPLTVHVRVSGPPADSAVRVIDPSASRDTLWLGSPNTLAARLAQPVEVTTFIASPGHRLHVEAGEGAGALSADGEMVVVLRTPRGPEVQAMAVPAELQRQR